MAEPKITDTPEFREAVRTEIASLRGELLGELAKAKGHSGATDTSWMEGLSMSIAKLTEQNSGRRYISPEVIRQREIAAELMLTLIVKAIVEKRPAAYRLTNKVHLNEQLIDPAWIDRYHTAQPTDIEWPGVFSSPPKLEPGTYEYNLCKKFAPNSAMSPLNDTARAIFKAFQDSIGSIAKDDAQAYAQESLKVTRNGLVVKGRPSAAKHETAINSNTGEPLETGGDTGGNEGLRVRHKDEPGRFKDVNILGTIAKPAQQSI